MWSDSLSVCDEEEVTEASQFTPVSAVSTGSEMLSLYLGIGQSNSTVNYVLLLQMCCHVPVKTRITTWQLYDSVQTRILIRLSQSPSGHLYKI